MKLDGTDDADAVSAAEPKGRRSYHKRKADHAA